VVLDEFGISLARARRVRCSSSTRFILCRFLYISFTFHSFTLQSHINCICNSFGKLDFYFLFFVCWLATTTTTCFDSGVAFVVVADTNHSLGESFANAFLFSSVLRDLCNEFISLGLAFSLRLAAAACVL